MHEHALVWIASVYVGIGVLLAAHHMAYFRRRGMVPGRFFALKILLLVLVWGPWMIRVALLRPGFEAR